MSQFLNRVRDLDPNDSDAVKEALSAFFQNLHKHKDNDCNRWLCALENVINRFPKYCGQHRVTIENYLVHFLLQSNNYYIIVEVAKCAHAVQQVRPQHERSASAKSCWWDLMSSLCEAAHTIIDALLANSGSISNENGNTQKSNSQLASPLQMALVDIDILTKPQDIANKKAVLHMRLRNVLVFIQAMLVEIYPVAKPIRPHLVLEVILQALSISGNEESSNDSTVKVQALRTLDALVVCLGSNLIPFSALVFKLVMQALRWSSANPNEESRKVRCTAYNSLTSWLNILHVHRESSDDRASSFENELTSHILDDVIPPKHVIQLTPNAQPMKNLSKKARKKLANSLLMQSNISTHMPGEKNKINLSKESNDELAVAALECAEAFLMSCGLFLEPSTHKQFQEALVRECFNIDNYSNERGLWLLRAVEACRKSVSPKVPPPTQYCLQLYIALLNNSQPEISKFVSQALLDIRLHLHCSPPSLNFALEAPPERKTKDGSRKRVSERNRAVLESLLGQERMPSEAVVEDEVITIPDEPQSKRLRPDEDVSDKISLSSESAASVEITEGSSVEEVEEEADLDDSTDYIIEPNILEMDKAFAFPLETEVCSQDLTAADAIEQIDETDGQDDVDDVDDADDADDIEQTDTSNGQVDVNAEIDTADDTLQDGHSNTPKELKIYVSKTQLPVSVNIYTEKSSPSKSQSSLSLSVEVGYDYPNTGQEKVTVLEKMDEDNLPSTNDTDDFQITCGQAVTTSQDAEPEVKELETNEVPKINGIEKLTELIVENGNATGAEIEDSVASKIVSNTGEVTVEDMLADFVDEVNDEIQVAS